MLLKHRPPSIQSHTTTLRAGFEHLDQNWVAVLRWLNDNKVDYVVVGPVARGIRGDRDARGPVAIVPAPYSRNFERLCNALVAEPAGLRAEAGGSHREESDARSADHAPAPRYQELVYEAARVELADGLSVQAASPEDL